MKDIKFKSPLYDASATWNGFSYQGKVGLYVCLKLIDEALTQNENIDDFCEQYCIEFEWLEDFSILNNSEYISHHQVKHYNQTDFSKYIDAFVTILSRQQGRLAENDLFKYIDYYTQVNKQEGFEKDKYIDKLINTLINCNLVDNNRFITDSDPQCLPDNPSDVTLAVKQYLYDCKVVQKQFNNAQVYVHTSKDISSPSIDLVEYIDIKKSKIKLSSNSKRTLKHEKILCSFDPTSKFELALDDDKLTKQLIQLSTSIFRKLKPNIHITNSIIIIYIAAIKDRLNKYVEKRHKDLGVENTILLSEKVKRKLPFTDILTCLRMEIIDESNDEYWELICRENFENAFQKQLGSLDEESPEIINNLKEYYKITYDNYIKKGKLASLLKAMKPHVSLCERTSKTNYYQQKIADEDDIASVFLSFIESLNIKHDDCFLFPKNGKNYQASTITVANSHPRLSSKAIKDLQVDFRDKFIYLNSDTDFIVIDSPKETEFTSRLEKFVEVPNVLGYAATENTHITSIKDITFLHYVLAQEELNE